MNDIALDTLGSRFASAKLPAGVAADICATDGSYPNPRYGTHLMTVAEAQELLAPLVTAAIEDAWRSGHATAEEVLGAHGSERLLDAIEAGWAEYAADNGLPSHSGAPQ